MVFGYPVLFCVVLIIFVFLLYSFCFVFLLPLLIVSVASFLADALVLECIFFLCLFLVFSMCFFTLVLEFRFYFLCLFVSLGP